MPGFELNPYGRTLKDATPGQAEFPTGTAGRGTADGNTEKEVFYSCQQCGHWNLQSRVASPGGTSDGNGGVVVVNGDPQIQRGFCGFCGTANSFKH